MAKSTRLVKSFTRLLFPAVMLVILAIAGASLWLTYTAAHPHSARYLVTPEKYGQLSSRGAQVTDETWSNLDGSTARGWLLRGAESAPAVILFHKYGADRSYVLNLGVKLNESTNFTILMPDLRAHGEDPPVKNSSFGGCESEDALAAVEYVRGLKTPNQISLVGEKIGVYGVEMGAVTALAAAAGDTRVKAIVLDSVPGDTNAVLTESVRSRFPFLSSVTTQFANVGTYLYYYDGCFKRENTCSAAKTVNDRDILLLAGLDAQDFQDPTSRISKCFPASNRIDSKLDLSPSGFSIINASMEQSESYDRRIIDFFRASLSN